MQSSATLDWATTALTWAERKALDLVEHAGGSFLHATRDGRYETMPAEWWTSGFWPGALLLLYSRLRDERLLNLARGAEDELARMFDDEHLYDLDHDVGFQFVPTAVARYKLTGDPEARRRGYLAATFLMSRFNPIGGFIEAWNGEQHRGMVIVDTLMNLPLLFWAAEEFGLPRFRNVAEAHADLAITHVVRPDGSTNHIVRFDQRTGERLEVLGGQGHAPDSCWSRGQAWALYGFAIAHRYTGRSDYLETARQVADSFLASMPPAGAPPWDFRAPDVAQAPRDSSAGAIAAAGLLELARAGSSDAGDRYHQAGTDLLRVLYEHYFSGEYPRQEGILLHATGELPLGKFVDVSLIYGDFFFLEALGKLHGMTETCW